jgi:glycogen debranching enzyme
MTSYDDTQPAMRSVMPAAASLADEATTLLAGTTFCVSGSSGDIDPDHAQGLFVDDTRIVSKWRLHVDGGPVAPLAAIPAEPYETTFVGRAAPRPGRADSTLVVERRRLVGAGMREDITLRNFSGEAAGVQVLLEVDADFADVFEVKGRQYARAGRVSRQAIGDNLLLWLERAGNRRGARISARGADATSGGLTFNAVVPAHGTWSATVAVLPSLAETELEAAFPIDRPVETAPVAKRMLTWRQRAAEISTGSGDLFEALVHSERDLGALRIVDPDHPDDDVVAAGAPWFMALFGRDSLITSWMALPFAPTLAIGTLRTLARLQGRKSDPITEEEPGRILHEVRLGMDRSLALGGTDVYYGSIDSTPLFVMLVDRAMRWGAPLDEISSLVPAVDAALDWMVTQADEDADQFIEYHRGTDRGLVNQGWKDSYDSVTFADGSFAKPPIALAEVQGYAYAAYRARAHIADVFGDPDTARTWRNKATMLRRLFDEAFWLPERGWYAMALDRDKRPVDALASNMGHCLWTGIVPTKRARQVADTLVSPALFTGFGIRTLAEGMTSYNPVSYHNGTVWPHDTALALAGLLRYGFTGHATQILKGLLLTADSFHGRLPELFCGFDAHDKPVPIPYPTSCSPQAWAAAAPYELLRAAIRLDVCVPHHEIHAAPALAAVAPVRVEGLPIGETKVTVRATTETVDADDLPPHMSMTPDGRPCSCNAIEWENASDAHG